MHLLLCTNVCIPPTPFILHVLYHPAVIFLFFPPQVFEYQRVPIEVSLAVQTTIFVVIVEVILASSLSYITSFKGYFCKL